MKLPDISLRAAREIDRILDVLVGEEVSPDSYIATISWGYDNPDPDCPATLGVGAEQAAKIPAEYIKQAHGIEVAFYLEDEEIATYADHALDYVHRAFVFVPKAEASSLVE